MEHMVSEGGVVIFNPTAGRGHGGRTVEEAKALLGPAFEWRPTQRAGHAVELAREAAKTHPVVVAFGGDGTVGDVTRGIVGTDATLGIIPVGTGNDVARNLRLKLDLQEAVSTVLSGVVRRIDLGTINGTPFINNAGTGFDAQVMRTMNSGIRFVRGQMAFHLAILKTFASYKPFTLTMTIDGEATATTEQPNMSPSSGTPVRLVNEPTTITEKAYMISILNGNVYAAGMQAAPRAEMDDGLLDVLLIKALPKAQLLPLIQKVTAGQHIGHPAVQMLQVRKLKIQAIPPQPLNIDGDVTGSTPCEIGVMPRALKVLVR
jgi:diacylglycerol kinase (ATP)